MHAKIEKKSKGAPGEQVRNRKKTLAGWLRRLACCVHANIERNRKKASWLAGGACLAVCMQNLEKGRGELALPAWLAVRYTAQHRVVEIEKASSWLLRRLSCCVHVKIEEKKGKGELAPPAWLAVGLAAH